MAELSSLGFENQTIADFELLTAYGSTTPTISTVDPKGGFQHLICSSNNHPLGFSSGSGTNINAGMWLKHTGIPGANVAMIFAWRQSPGYWKIVWNKSSGFIELLDTSDTVLASVSESFMGAQGTYNHYGLNARTDVSGWVSFYVNGTLAMKLTGNVPSTVWSGVYFGGTFSGSGWSNPAYIDDIYVDRNVDDTDKPTFTTSWQAVFPSTDTFFDWTPITGSSNFAMVDDAPSDEDLTYNHASTDEDQDTFSFPNPGVPAGHKIRSVSFFVRSKVENTGPLDWWDFGTPLVAYAAVGASSQSDSKIDLTGNGNNITLWNGSEPTWSTITGWTFSGSNAYFVGGGLGVGKTYTIAVRFSNAVSSSGHMLGANDNNTVPEVLLNPYDNVNNRVISNWGDEPNNGPNSDGKGFGTIVFNEDEMYYQGSQYSTPSSVDWGAGAGVQTLNLTLGGRNIGIIVANKWAGKIQAFAMYSDKLSGSDMSNLTANMNAL